MQSAEAEGAYRCAGRTRRVVSSTLSQCNDCKQRCEFACSRLIELQVASVHGAPQKLDGNRHGRRSNPGVHRPVQAPRERIRLVASGNVAQSFSASSRGASTFDNRLCAVRAHAVRPRYRKTISFSVETETADRLQLDRASFRNRPITLGVSLISADSGNGGRAFAAHFVRTCRQRMCLQPKRAGRCCRVNASLLPPCRFVATAMQLAMMAAAKRRCVLIADLATKCPPLDKAQMMRV